MSKDNLDAAKDPLDAEQAERFYEIVRQVAEEMSAGVLPSSLNLSSSLSRDFGIDSLGRVELLRRLDLEFGRDISADRAVSADTPAELWLALSGGSNLLEDNFFLQSSVLDSSRVSLPHAAVTLNEVLCWHAERTPERVHIFLYEDGGEEVQITYRQLFEESQKVAAGLRSSGVSQGQTVALMLPTSCDFLYSFFGILFAGAVPVPIYPPVSAQKIEDHLLRQIAVLKSAEASLMLSVKEARSFSRLLQFHLPTLSSVLTREQLCKEGCDLAFPKSCEQDIALIQYTSGSTGQPKGVVLTHANLLANVRAMGQALEVSSDDVFVSWLPLYHDMGLIGAWFGNLYHGIPLILMSPLSFVARPQRWLRAIDRHRGTISAAPNFAYEICARRLTDSVLKGLNLSSWRLALNGAEPVIPSTINKFAERFAEYGFCREAIHPVYGLAENSVGLAFPKPGKGPRVDRVKRFSLEHNGYAEEALPEEKNVLEFVSCGQPIPGHEIRLVDRLGVEVGERVEGSLQFRGPSSTAGYYRNAEASERLISDSWLESGDYAYLADGDIFITGRSKDIIIKAGRNIYPHEIEQIIGEIPKLRKGCVAAFGVRDERSGSELLIVAAEAKEQNSDIKAALVEQAKRALVENLDVVADKVVLVPPRTLPKTSSGKIRRSGAKILYEKGLLEQSHSLAGQYFRIVLSGVSPALGRFSRRLAEVSYVVYAYLLFALVVPPVWLAVVLSPSVYIARLVVRVSARVFFFLAGIPISVEGLENLSTKEPSVLVANHASYLDSLLLTALLPPRFSFVVKKELSRPFVPRLFLRSLGSLFIERFSSREGLEDIKQIVASVSKGCSVVFFPEGTFSRAPGLQKFRVGAFKVALESRVPVVPIAIKGTRAILRGDQFVPRRGGVAVRIFPALIAEGNDWSKLLELRTRSREQILSACGEPDLG